MAGYRELIEACDDFIRDVGRLMPAAPSAVSTVRESVESPIREESAFCKRIRQLGRMTDAELAAEKARWSSEQWTAYYRHRGISPPGNDSLSRILNSNTPKVASSGTAYDSFSRLVEDDDTVVWEPLDDPAVAQPATTSRLFESGKLPAPFAETFDADEDTLAEIIDSPGTSSGRFTENL